jgi:hypothetical protein
MFWKKRLGRERNASNNAAFFLPFININVCRVLVRYGGTLCSVGAGTMIDFTRIRFELIEQEEGLDGSKSGMYCIHSVLSGIPDGNV